jgi:uncharacterized protein with PQ loop repeat
MLWTELQFYSFVIYDIFTFKVNCHLVVRLQAPIHILNKTKKFLRESYRMNVSLPPRMKRITDS